MALRYYTVALAWLGAAIATRLADNADQAVPASWCFTYLSDLLVHVPTIPPSTATGTQPVILNPSSISQLPLGPSSLSGSLFLPSPSPILSTEILTATSTTVTSLPTPSTQVNRQLILLVTPSAASRRYLHARAATGFLNIEATLQQSCANATVFTLASGQLSDASGIPIYYSLGDTFKPLRSAGSLLDGATAITTTFSDNNGVLEFSNPSLPGGRASFCEDDTGRVYITFTSSPANCVPVSLTSYDGRAIFSLNTPVGNMLTTTIVQRCRNGQIDGVNLPSPTQTSLPSASSVPQSAPYSSSAGSEETYSSQRISVTTGSPSDTVSSSSIEASQETSAAASRSTEDVPSLPSSSSSMTSSESVVSSSDQPEMSSSFNAPSTTTTALDESSASSTVSTTDSSSGALSTESLSTEASSTEASSTEPSSTEASSTEESSTEASATEASSTLSTSSATPTPVCTSGLEYSTYLYDLTSTQCNNLLWTWAVKDPYVMDLGLIVQGVVPQGTGTTQVLYAADYDNWLRPYTIYGYTAPDYTDSSHTCLAVQHRGYVKFPTTGIYTFSMFTDLSPFGEVDDNLYVWLGDLALSGNFNPRNSQVRKLFESEINAQKTYDFVVTNADEIVPIRVFFANRLGPGYFKLTITGPEGEQPSLLSCSGTQVAPDWLPWEQERVLP